MDDFVNNEVSVHHEKMNEHPYYHAYLRNYVNQPLRENHQNHAIQLFDGRQNVNLQPFLWLVQ